MKVPAGVLPGDTIAVKSHDGRRTVNATVPPGMNCGQTFMVRFPPSPPPSKRPQPIKPIVQPEVAKQQTTPTFAQALDAFMTQIEAAATPVPDPVPTPAKTAPSPDGKHASEEARQEEIQSYSFSENVDNILSPEPVPESQQPVKQKYLLVNIPPGTQPGTTIHVQVPGENRTLAAEVPPGVTSFRVAYTPRRTEPSKPLSPPVSQQQLQRLQPLQAPVDPNRAMGQKLLSVQVPPGTSPGATLHVAVPDEPGRILAAQVPPGNLQNFHVAYVPRTLLQQTNQQGFMPMADPYNPGPTSQQSATQTTEQRYSQQPQSYTSNNMLPAFNPEYNNLQGPQNNTYQNNTNGGGGNVGDYVLPTIGAAALGTAAYATYDHFTRQNN